MPISPRASRPTRHEMDIRRYVRIATQFDGSAAPRLEEVIPPAPA